MVCGKGWAGRGDALPPPGSSQASGVEWRERPYCIEMQGPPSRLMAERKPHFLPSLRNEGDLSSPSIPPWVNQRSGRAKLHPHSLLGSLSCLLSLLTVIGTGASREQGPGSLFGHDFQGCETRSTLPPCTHIFLSVPNYKTPPRGLR